MHAKARDYGIPGTPIFDGAQAQKGYALNKMCYSFNSAANREAFQRDEERLREVRPRRGAAKRDPQRNVAELIRGVATGILRSSPASSASTAGLGAHRTQTSSVQQKLRDAARRPGEFLGGLTTCTPMIGRRSRRPAHEPYWHGS